MSTEQRYVASLDVSA
ncbi:hypothetical protein SEA_FREDDYB_51 [Mycobacterium phage FreddyB]